MSRIKHPVILYDPALPEESQEQLRRTGPFDVVLGIPSHRNARTIGEVVEALVEGVSSYLPDQRVLIVNADGGSSDNTCRYLDEIETPANVTKLICVYAGPMGKGNGIRAILEAAALCDARACAVVEARCPGITPEWVHALVDPILNSGNDLAIATYDRSPVASALTDNLAYPFVRLFFNADLREPLASEFCVSGGVAQEMAARDVWETDVSRFGVNIWATMQALADGRRVVQVDLGYRGDGHCDPGVLGDLRFLHMVGTLFRFLAVYGDLWQQDLPLREIPYAGRRSTGQPHSSIEYLDALRAGYREGLATMGAFWRQTLADETMRAVQAVGDDPAGDPGMTPELWAQVAIEFAVVYNRGEGDPDRVAEALLPLFWGRAAAYVREVDNLTREERAPHVDRLVRAFLSRKRGLVSMWSQYRPWIDPSGYWPNE